MNDIASHGPSCPVCGSHLVGDSVNVPIHGIGGVVAYAVVDPSDFAAASSYRWNLQSGYAVSERIRARVFMHRLVAGALPGVEVDHINHVKLDNRRINLRLCSRSENAMNMKPRSGRALPKGVRKNRKGWQAYICVNYITHRLGTYPTVEMAREARLEAEARFHGPFAYKSPAQQETA